MAVFCSKHLTVITNNLLLTVIGTLKIIELQNSLILYLLNSIRYIDTLLAKKIGTDAYKINLWKII